MKYFVVAIFLCLGVVAYLTSLGVALKQHQVSHSGTYQTNDKMIDSVPLHPNNTIHVNTFTQREREGEGERD